MATAEENASRKDCRLGRFFAESTYSFGKIKKLGPPSILLTGNYHIFILGKVFIPRMRLHIGK
jgi:hypothetical protein